MEFCNPSPTVDKFHPSTAGFPNSTLPGGNPKLPDVVALRSRSDEFGIMKKCLQCCHENGDDALACHNCRHRAFEPGDARLPKSVSRRFVSKNPHLLIETDGKLSVLKCRTPNEAFLVAEELEAADILVMFPDEEAMLQEFNAHGYVSIKVSARSYEAAKELQGVIECGQWQHKDRQALSIKMALVAIGLGIMFCPGLIFFFMLYKQYENKGFSRKAGAFGKWFIVGFAIVMVLIALVRR